MHKRAARDLIDVKDVATVIDRLLARGLRSETVNVAAGYAVPVQDIVDRLRHGLGLRARHEYRDAGGQHAISIEKVRALVPQVASPGFGPDHHRRILAALPTPSCPAPAVRRT
ncbi:hypothetical protein [Streptomyces sp. NBC_00576]|uniref:hypothetical protein n=1 Tax=Streptomyces sp. NBC_00576 TaxID=2903665 RepID=UPI002E824978|nr:hypothetical protein [Streptomyces sp. NBC_00576]WUB73468.1 hypothetical protein OG734_27205 [Streptomyces sp. NBC_00576]